MQIAVFQTKQPMSTPEIPSVAAERRAQADQLTERANILDQIGVSSEADPALKMFVHPSLADLQAEERVDAEDIADFLALRLYGRRSPESLTPDQRRRIESAATYAVRRPFAVWTRQAHVKAEDSLIDVFTEAIPGFKDMAPEKRREFAIVVTRIAWAAFIGVLEGTTPTTPANYLRAFAEITMEGGR